MLLGHNQILAALERFVDIPNVQSVDKAPGRNRTFSVSGYKPDAPPLVRQGHKVVTQGILTPIIAVPRGPSRFAGAQRAYGREAEYSVGAVTTAVDSQVNGKRPLLEFGYLARLLGLQLTCLR